ncbi:MAG: phosphotransferase [Elusimicrobia bacterium]|nr:phosphotransferase [Elusimicrobiota bacterium]
MTACLAEIRTLFSRPYSKPDIKLATALTHGDFQPANIMVDKDKVWLVDWEYSDIRQIVYDGLVYALRSRFPCGLSGRIQWALAQDNGAVDEFLKTWPETNWGNRLWRRMALTVFLMEEIVLHLKINDNPLFYSLDQGLRCYCLEIAKALRCLKGQ